MFLQDSTTKRSHDLLDWLQMVAAGVEESELASKPVHTVEAGANELLWPLYTFMLSFIANTGMYGPRLLHNTVCDISE